MIIVEGPDGAGKTTLIKRLAKGLNLKISRRVVDRDTRPMTDLRKWVECEGLSRSWTTILDRHRLISEPIYGPIMGRDPGSDFYDLDWLRNVTDKFHNMQNLLVWCMPPLEVVLSNVCNDPDNQAVVGHIVDIYHAYVAMCAQYTQSASWQVYYDYTKGEDEYQAVLKEYLHWREYC